MAFDSAGNLFVGGSDGIIYEYAPDGTQSIFASGYLFESDYNTGNIYEFMANGTRSTFASAIWPEALAFNGAGDLFVAEYSENISQFTPDGQQSVFAPWWFDTYGMAFDGAGDLFATAWDMLHL